MWVVYMYMLGITMCDGYLCICEVSPYINTVFVPNFLHWHAHVCVRLHATFDCGVDEGHRWHYLELAQKRAPFYRGRCIFPPLITPWSVYMVVVCVNLLNPNHFSGNRLPYKEHCSLPCSNVGPMVLRWSSDAFGQIWYALRQYNFKCDRMGGMVTRQSWLTKLWKHK